MTVGDHQKQTAQIFLAQIFLKLRIFLSSSILFHIPYHLAQSFDFIFFTRLCIFRFSPLCVVVWIQSNQSRASRFGSIWPKEKEKEKAKRQNNSNWPIEGDNTTQRHTTQTGKEERRMDQLVPICVLSGFRSHLELVVVESGVLLWVRGIDELDPVSTPFTFYRNQVEQLKRVEQNEMTSYTHGRWFNLFGDVNWWLPVLTLSSPLPFLSFLFGWSQSGVLARNLFARQFHSSPTPPINTSNTFIDQTVQKRNT